MKRTSSYVVLALVAGLVGFVGGSASAATNHYVKATGAVSAPGTSCGQPGYNSIQDAINGAAAGDTIVVCPGTYVESNISVDKALTIDGQQYPRVVPAGEDANLNSAVAPPVQNGFVIRSDDVTIRDLIIDGEGNPALTPGKNNYRTAIITDPAVLAPAFNNTIVEDVVIRHIYRRGIQLRGGTGHVLDHNSITDVTVSDGIVVFECTVAITDNDIRQTPEGIGTNYLTTPANAPLVQVTGNRISGMPDFGVGMNLSGLAEGSIARDNAINMKAGGADQVGVIAQYAVGTVRIDENDVQGEGDDSGIWLYHNEDPANPVIVTANHIESHDATDDGTSSATGIFITDDGPTFFGDEPGDSYAVLEENRIMNWIRGIHEYRNLGRVLDTTAHLNCLVGNSAFGALVSGLFAGPPNMDATNNWWGAGDGPSGVGPGQGDAVSTFVDFEPWATNSSVC